MDLVIFRAIHIIAGFVWVGLGATVAWVLHPFFKEAANGDKMMRDFYTNSLMNKIFPVAAIVTTVAGLYVFWRIGWGAGYTTVGNAVLGTGVLVGLLAFGHGAAATGRNLAKFATASRAVEGEPTAEQQPELDELKRKVHLHSNISAWLAVIALVAMSSARYL